MGPQDHGAEGRRDEIATQPLAGDSVPHGIRPDELHAIHARSGATSVNRTPYAASTASSNSRLSACSSITDRATSGRAAHAALQSRGSGSSATVQPRYLWYPPRAGSAIRFSHADAMSLFS